MNEPLAELVEASAYAARALSLSKPALTPRALRITRWLSLSKPTPTRHVPCDTSTSPVHAGSRINPLAEPAEANAHSPRALRHLDKLGARRLTHRVPFDRLRARITRGLSLSKPALMRRAQTHELTCGLRRSKPVLTRHVPCDTSTSSVCAGSRINPRAEPVEASAYAPRTLRHLDKPGARRLTRSAPFDKLRARIKPLAEPVEASAHAPA